MVLKIDRTANNGKVLLTLSGRMHSDEVQRLKAYIEDEEKAIAFDLSQVHLVNLDAVRFLAWCEKHGIELFNCRPHVRAWIAIERPRISDLE